MPQTHHDVAAVPPVFSCLVVGLGNCLLCDDGIGVHAARELMKKPPADTMILEVGTHVFRAVNWLEIVPRVLVIDAMDAGSPPGSLYWRDGRDIHVARRRASLHELNLLSGLESTPKAKWPLISILGVQPAVIEYGLELSPALKDTLPGVVEAARTVVAGWLSTPSQTSKAQAAATISGNFPSHSQLSPDSQHGLPGTILRSCDCHLCYENRRPHAP